jgi:hypothetical protein
VRIFWKKKKKKWLCKFLNVMIHQSANEIIFFFSFTEAENHIKNFGTCLTHFSPNTCQKICRFNLSGGILTRRFGSQQISDAKKQPQDSGNLRTFSLS